MLTRKKIATPAKTTSLTPLSTYCSQSMARDGPGWAAPVRMAEATAPTMSATSSTMATREVR
ncbi:MAG: hypothetical protein ABJA74_09040 [Lapillicoccus sp.]